MTLPQTNNDIVKVAIRREKWNSSIICWTMPEGEELAKVLAHSLVNLYDLRLIFLEILTRRV